MYLYIHNSNLLSLLSHFDFLPSKAYCRPSVCFCLKSLFLLFQNKIFLQEVQLMTVWAPYSLQKLGRCNSNLGGRGLVKVLTLKKMSENHQVSTIHTEGNMKPVFTENHKHEPQCCSRREVRGSQKTKNPSCRSTDFKGIHQTVEIFSDWHNR